MKKFGIDISTWQAGYPYYRAQQEGVEFAILRAGYSNVQDEAFETHYASLKALGIPVGAYWYMYATNTDQAIAEARAFLSVLSGKQFEYPVYLDLEDPSIRGLSRSVLDQMVRAFCDTVQEAGYYVGVYTNIDWYNNVISGDELNKSYDWWIASWGTQEPTGLNYGMWQFGGSTNTLRSPKIAGVTTDQNYAYKDYPAMMLEGGFNGFSAGSKPAPTPTPSINVEPAPAGNSLLSAGDIVQVKNPVQYDGKPFVAYFSTYEVIEVKGDRAVIGKGGVVTAAVSTANLVKIGGGAETSYEICTGDKVKVLQAIQYNGQPFAVYYPVYDVIEINGNRVVIGINGVVTAAVNKANLQRV